MSRVSGHLIVPPAATGPGIPYEQQLEMAAATLPETLPSDPRHVLLALDIDGTLITETGASKKVKDSIAEAIEAGINVVIATGRSLGATMPVLGALRFPGGFSVSSNGAQTLFWERAADGRHVYNRIKEWLFDPEETAATLQDHVPGVVLGVDDGREGILVSEAFAPDELLTEQRVTSFRDLVRKPTTRMIARASHMDREDFVGLLKRADLRDVEYAVGWTSWADITARGCTKARGLADLAEDLGVPHSGTISVGDGDNDIPMLKWAAHGVAMGTASQEVRQAADAVTGAVDFDGAAAVIEAVTNRF